MKLIIEIPNTDIPKRQDILSVDLCFIDGQVGQCTYPCEILKREPIEVLQEIRQEILNRIDYKHHEEWIDDIIHLIGDRIKELSE